MRHHDHVEASDQLTSEPYHSTCPWCPYTASLKKVPMHMESAHYRQWCDLVLSPPITGGVY